MSRSSGWEVVGVLAGIAGVAGVVAFTTKRAHAGVWQGDMTDPRPRPPQPTSQPTPPTPQDPPTPTPTPQPPSVQPPGVEAWRPYVRMLAPAFGLVGPGWEAFIMQYITMESGGRPCSIGFPGELDANGLPLESGIGQFMSPHDIALAGTTVAEMRAACAADVRFPGLTRMSPPAEIAAARAKEETQVRPLTEAEKHRQVTALLTFLAAIARIVDKSFAEHGVTWPKSSADYLAMIKGYHAGQSFPTAGVAAAKRALGRAPRTWGEFASGYLSTIGDANTRARHAHALDNARRAGAGSGLAWLTTPATTVAGIVPGGRGSRFLRAA